MKINDILGSKRLLSTVFHQLAAKGLNTKKLWKEIKLIIVKTVLAMVPEMILHYEHHFHDSPAPQCFQVFNHHSIYYYYLHWFFVLQIKS